MKLNKDESVGSFFTKIKHVRDQLLAIGVTVDDDDLVQTVVDGLPVAAFHTPGGDMAEIFKPLDVPLRESLESRHLVPDSSA